MTGLADPESIERWWQEHSELDLLVESLEQAMDDGSIARAGAALEELANALEEHFTVEERVYFPLVEQLSSEHAPIVRAASLGHAKIRDRLDTLRDLVANGEIAPARRGLAVLLDRFRTHEAEEAKLVGELVKLGVDR